MSKNTYEDDRYELRVRTCKRIAGLVALFPSLANAAGLIAKHPVRTRATLRLTRCFLRATHERRVWFRMGTRQLQLACSSQESTHREHAFAGYPWQPICERVSQLSPRVARLRFRVPRPSAMLRSRKVLPACYTQSCWGRFLHTLLTVSRFTTCNTNLHSSVDRGGSEEPIAKHPVRTQAYSGVRRGERRNDNEGIRLKVNWY